MGRSAPEALASGARVNGYRIDGLINAGGFGMVYRAWDGDQERLNRRRTSAERRRAGWSGSGYNGPGPNAGPTVAIKECLPADFVSRPAGVSQVAVSSTKRSSFAWALERFDDEARFLIAQSHPALVTGWEVFSDNGTRYLVMEALPPDTLERMVEARGAQSEATIRQWLRPVLHALRHTEAAGVNHLDLSPGNVLFRTSMADPVLIDFGASRFGAKAVRRGVSYPVVNNGYSAPEKSETTSYGLDARCDVYSLAAVAIFALTGEAPPAAEERKDNPEALRLAIRRAQPQASGAFVEALIHCMAMRPSERPSAAAAMERLVFGSVSEPGGTPVKRREPKRGGQPRSRLDVAIRHIGQSLKRRGFRLEQSSRRSALAVMLIAGGAILIILLAANL